MDQVDVVVVGGGIAGLQAAVLLGRTRRVLLLEARPRLGGRILTLRDMPGGPIELGAEFIHGKPPALCDLLREGKLEISKVQDRHWQSKDGALRELPDFWEKLAGVTEQIDPAEADSSFAAFLSRIKAPCAAKTLALEFVEGFHGGPVRAASTHAIGESEDQSEDLDGESQFRIQKGYGALVDFLAGRCLSAGVQLQTGAVVRQIDWRPGKVELRCVCEAEPIRARAAVITLPIGVLRAGRVRFEPPIKAKEELVQLAGIASARKVLLEFREAFWPSPELGFVHSEHEWFPTWWSRGEAPLLTGWAGGERARRLAGCKDDFVTNRALEALACIFGEKPARLRSLLVRAWTHDWLEDPYSLCAYSFVRVDSDFSRLAEPVEKTLYFAGEATDQEHQLGTVHGALQSALRVTKEIENDR